MTLLKKIRRLLPFPLRAEYFRIRRHLASLLSHAKYASGRAIDDSFSELIFEHRSQIVKQYPEPWYSSQFNKRINLKIASDRIDQLVLYPGELFSFWHLVGRPLSIKGYKKALEMHDGKLTISSAGGLCQISNALYWCALNCGLAIVERHRHSYDLFPDTERKVPFGAGATVFYNYHDLIFKNESSPVMIRCFTDDDFLYIKVFSREKQDTKYLIEERNHRFEQIEGSRVRINEIYRIALGVEGERVSEEFISENRGLVMY